MKVSEMFPPREDSKWLAAPDLQGREHQVTIERIDRATFSDGTFKPAVFFKGKGKALTLNWTNYTSISDNYGDEAHNWVGKDIVLFPTKTRDKQGKIVDCIRVRMPQSGVQTAPTGFEAPVTYQKPMRAEIPPVDNHAAFDDDAIPF